MKTVRALLAFGVLSLSMVCTAAPEATGVVRVAEVSGRWLGAGFVADDKGHVIARIEASNKPLLVTTIAGHEHVAGMVSRDRVSGLSLLQITGNVTGLKPYVVAHSPVEPQRRVFGVKVDEELSQSEVVGGALAAIRQPQTGALTGYYLHNALTGEPGIGGPLLNNCGEVVGIIVPQPKSLARLLVRDGEETAYAVPIAWSMTQFGIHGLSPRQSAIPCLSEAEQAAASQAKLEEESQRAAAASAQAAEAQNKLEEESQRAAAAAAQATEAQNKLEEESQRAAAAAQAAQAELDAVRNQLERAQDTGEEERQRLQEEIATRQAALDEAQARAVAADGALEAARRASEARTKQYGIWGILGAGALLLLLLLVWAIKQRAVTRAHREEAAARARAEAAQADLAVRDQERERIRRTPTVFLEGADSAGKNIALRIPGASIAAGGGAVVGRNPADSDFVINHPEVSRRQFRLFSDGDLLMIEDLGSTNGTRVDGKDLAAGQEHLLADRSHLALGHLDLSVRLESND